MHTKFILSKATKIILETTIQHVEMTPEQAAIVRNTDPVEIFADCKAIARRRRVPIHIDSLRKDCFIAHMLSQSHPLSDEKQETGEAPPPPPPMRSDVSSVVLQPTPPAPYSPVIIPVPKEKKGFLTPDFTLSEQAQKAIHSTVDHIGEVAKQFKEGITSHGESIEKASDKFTKLFDEQVKKFNVFKDQLVNKAEALVSDIKTVETITSFVAKVISLIAGVYGVVHAKDMTTKAIIAMLTAAALGISSIPGVVEKLVASSKKLFNYFSSKSTPLDESSKHFAQEIRQEAEATGFSPHIKITMSDKSEARSSLTTFFDVVKSIFIPLDKNQQKSVIEDARLIESYVKLIKLGKDLMTSVMNVVNIAFEYLYHIVNGVPYNMPSMVTDLARRLLTGAEHLEQNFSESKLAGNTQLQQQVQFLYGLAIDFEETALTEKFNPASMSAVRDAIKTIKSCHSSLCNFLKITKRAAPASILLYGEPGVNKSDAVKVFEKAIRLQYPELAQRRDLLISIKDSKHWEGYNGQLICVLDDLLQINSATERAIEALKIIRIINTDPFILEYANLEDKGKNYFQSPIVIGTTNVDWLKHIDCGLTAPQALKRRFELVVHVVEGPGKDWDNLEKYHLIWYRYDYLEKKHQRIEAGNMKKFIPYFLEYVDSRLNQSAQEQVKTRSILSLKKLKTSSMV
jgi:tetratricopeptide (TPR) repeat protein